MQTNQELLRLAFARRETLLAEAAQQSVVFKSCRNVGSYVDYLLLPPSDASDFLKTLPEGVTGVVWEMTALAPALKALDLPLKEDTEAHFNERQESADTLLPTGFPVSAMDIVNFAWFECGEECIASGRSFVQITDDRTFVFGGVSDIDGVTITGKLGSPIKAIDWETFVPGVTHLWSYTTEDLVQHACLSSDEAPDFPNDIHALDDYEAPDDDWSYKLEIGFEVIISNHNGCRNWSDLIRHQKEFGDLRKQLSKNRKRIISLGGECSAYGWEKE